MSAACRFLRTSLNYFIDAVINPHPRHHLTTSLIEVAGSYTFSSWIKSGQLFGGVGQTLQCRYEIYHVNWFETHFSQIVAPFWIISVLNIYLQMTSRKKKKREQQTTHVKKQQKKASPGVKSLECLSNRFKKTHQTMSPNRGPAPKKHSCSFFCWHRMRATDYCATNCVKVKLVMLYVF